MNRRRLIIIGLSALAVAALVTLAAVRLVTRTIAANTKPMTRIVVAINDLGVGEAIEERSVRLAEIPTAEVPPNAFFRMSDVIGRGVVIPMSKNEAILASKLAPDKAGAGLPSMIPPKMRAVSVKVNEVISVAGFVKPGTRVDVLLTGSPTGRGTAEDQMATTVLENVEVLASGKEMQQNPNDGKPQQVTVITLLVTPEDAQKLALAANEGKIQLSLRNPLDLEKPSPNAVRNVALYRSAPLPEVKKAKHATGKTVIPPPQSAYLVEVIKGDKRDTTKF